MDAEQMMDQGSQPDESEANNNMGGDFIDMNDAVEVKVDETNQPMDDETTVQGVGDAEDGAGNATEVVDMAQLKFESHTDHVYAVAAHLDAATNTLSILSGGGDDKSFLHRAVSGGDQGSKPLAHAHTDSVACAAFNFDCGLSPDATKTPPLAAIGGYDGAIVTYNPLTGDKVQQLEGPTDVEWLCFHPKGGTVLLAGSVADGTVWMYFLPTSKCMQVFVGHEKGVTAGAFTPDGKFALSASQDGTLRVWAPRTGMCKHTFKTGEAGLTCLGIGGGSDGQLVLVGAEDGAGHVCHIGTKKIVAALRHFEAPVGTNMNEDEEMELPMSVEAVGFSPSNPNWCATGGVDGVLKIWDLANGGQCRQVCKRPVPEDAASQSASAAPKSGITRLRWHPTMPLVLTAATDGVVRLWDARNGNMIKEATGHSDVINDMDVTFTEDGGHALVVTASDDKTVRVFDIDISGALQGS